MLQIFHQKFKIIRAVFTLICIALALYMSSLQVYRYFENNDTPSFSNKEFNESPADMYPSFSYCFEDNFGGIYDKQHFSEFDGLTRQQYQNFLLGKSELLQNGSDQNVANIFDIDVDNITLKQKKLFSTLEIRTANQSVENTKTYSDHTGDEFLPLYKSYQDPIKVCFTRKSTFKQGLTRQTDELIMWLTKKLWEMLTRRTKVKIYIHPDGQLTRAFRKPTYWYNLQKGFWPTPVNQYLRLQIVKVSVLRKRPDSKTPCNPDLIDDDKEFRDQVMGIVGCVPPYWKQFQSKPSYLNVCRTPDKLKEIFDQITNFKTIFKHYNPPCNDMSLITSADIASVSNHGMILWYLSERYEETINRRDFRLEMLWSSIGGFVGIFLGYSLLQLPDMLPRLKN